LSKFQNKLINRLPQLRTIQVDTHYPTDQRVMLEEETEI
jgi:hypothetical protein